MRRTTRQSGASGLGPLLATVTVVGLMPSMELEGQSQREPTLEPCALTLPNGQAVPPPTSCGWLPVPEDPNDVDGRWIDLRVVVIGAASDDPLPDPVVKLMGGPGQAAAQLAQSLALGHRRMFPHRDLVMVDQRGTGQSNGLYCPSDEAVVGTAQDLVRHVFDVDDAQACRRALERQTDLSLYHTTVAAGDLERVLTWLGYDRVNLVGGSYGTRMAQVFMRLFPERVRAAILDGVVPMNALSPAPYSLESTDAMWRLVQACAQQKDCGRAFPNIVAEVEELFARLSEGPVTVPVQDPISRTAVTLRVPMEVFGYAVRGMLYSGQQFPDLPAELHAAYRGDYAPLVERYLNRKLAFSGNALAMGMYFSVLCTEDIPFVTEEHVDMNQGTIMGDALIQQYRGACRGWPRGELPAGFHDPVAVDVPTLLISGEYDPSTTGEMGEYVAKHLTEARHIRIRGGGHGTGSNPSAPACVMPIRQAFVNAGTVRGLDRSCLRDVQRPAFRVPSGG